MLFFPRKLGFFSVFLAQFEQLLLFHGLFSTNFQHNKIEKKRKTPSNRLGFNYFQFKSSLTIHLILLHLDFKVLFYC